MNFKTMKILMLEDEEYEQNRFKNHVNERIDVDLITINSCHEALNYIESNNVEGIIVDIELNEGIGESGLSFLKDLKKLSLNLMPLIIVTTKISSKRVHNKAHELGADMVFYKGKTDYSPELVINTFITLRDSLRSDISQNVINDINLESAENKQNRMKNKINAELDLIGISYEFLGREYIFDAIHFLLNNSKEDAYYLPFLTNKYKTRNSNISNAIQSAINNAWKHTPYEDIEKYYTARVSHIKGTPTPTEFIHYYAEKIKKALT